MDDRSGWSPPSSAIGRTMRARLSERTLEFVNVLRHDAGLPPAPRIEPGLRFFCDDCALARTIGGGASVSRRRTTVLGREYRNPWSVRLWLGLFDRLAYPELATLRRTRTGIDHLDFPAPTGGGNERRSPDLALVATGPKENDR